MIERLDELFGIKGALTFQRDSHQWPKAILQDDSGHRVEILLYGGQVLSWQTPKNDELLFVSSKANFQRGKPVRGGIPLVFPQFGKGELPSHGFARTSAWEVKRSASPQPGAVSVTFELLDNRSTMDIWPHPFVVELTVTLNKSLKTEMKVVNCGTTPLYFFAGFHTYFRLADITRTQILGLQGITFIDTRRGAKSYGVQQPEALIIDEETDRNYLNAPNEVQIVDQLLNRTVTVKKKNIKDLVVWNPWAEKSKEFQDLGPQEFSSFVCVEPMIVNQKITLEPRQTHEFGQELSYQAAS